MVTQNKYTNEPISDYKSGKITKKEASNRIRNIYAGGGGPSSSSVNRAAARGAAIRAAAQVKAQAEAAAQAITEQQRQAALLVAQQKAQEIQSLREQKIKEAMDKQRQLGFLPTRESVTGIVDARIQAEIKRAEQEAIANAGATGEVTSVPDRNIVEKVIADPGRIIEALETKIDVKGGGKKIIKAVPEQYKKAEKFVSEKLYDVTGFSKEQSKKQRERVLESESLLRINTETTTQFLIENTPNNKLSNYAILFGSAIANIGITTGTMIAGFSGTTADKTLDKPITETTKYVAYGAAGYTLGLGFAGTSALFGGTTGAVASGYFGGGTSALIVPTLQATGGALGLGFLYKTGSDVINAETNFERGGIIGKTILETSAIGAGFISGKQDAAKIGDILRTRGRTEVPVEDILLKDILTGDKKFVESSSYGYNGPQSGKGKQAFDLKVFSKKDYAYHVTPDQYWKTGFTTVEGTSEFPGLYTAPSPSVYFAKVGGKQSYKLSLFGSGFEASSKPSVAQIYTGFTINQKTPGAFVSGIKPEIEAIIGPGKDFAKVGGNEFFKFGGRRFPIDIFKQVGPDDIASISNIAKVSASGSSSGYSAPVYSLINIPTLTVASVISDSSSSSVTGDKIVYPSSISSKDNTSYTSDTSPSIIYSGGSVVRSSGSSGGSSKIYKSPIPVPSSIIPSSIRKSVIKPLPSYIDYKKSNVGRSYYDEPIRNIPQPQRIKFSSVPKYKAPTGLFGVQVRRGGVFRDVGTYKSSDLAFKRGKGIVEGTVAATFKVTGGKGLKLKTPKYFTRKETKEGTLFIEKKSRRIKKKKSGSKESEQLKKAKRRKGK